MSRLVLVRCVYRYRYRASNSVSLLCRHASYIYKKGKISKRYQLEQFLLITTSGLFPVTVSRIKPYIIIIFDLCFHQDFQDNQDL